MKKDLNVSFTNAIDAKIVSLYNNIAIVIVKTEDFKQRQAGIISPWTARENTGSR